MVRVVSLHPVQVLMLYPPFVQVGASITTGSPHVCECVSSSDPHPAISIRMPNVKAARAKSERIFLIIISKTVDTFTKPRQKAHKLRLFYYIIKYYGRKIKQKTIFLQIINLDERQK